MRTGRPISEDPRAYKISARLTASELEEFEAYAKRQGLNRFKIMDYKHAYRLVFEYIETFYNTVRIHSHCGYLSPDEYEKHYWKELLQLEQKLVG